eukprot:TRINITY_DN12087_c0_g1_i3.p1 TRINITY_DN12087_c0_g1~~TRINITY_DN12087_c0_g1_i3.p1  ORF type:complete len:699 (+),score=163.94 TRINITY_DN12087_c0_g1_i3:100-2097(+)
MAAAAGKRGGTHRALQRRDRTCRLMDHHVVITPEGMTLEQKYGGDAVARLNEKQTGMLRSLWGNELDENTRPIMVGWAAKIELALRLGTKLVDPPAVRVQAVQGGTEHAEHPPTRGDCHGAPPTVRPGPRGRCSREMAVAAPVPGVATQRGGKGGNWGYGGAVQDGGYYSPARHSSPPPTTVGWSPPGESQEYGARHQSNRSSQHPLRVDWDEGASYAAGAGSDWPDRGGDNRGGCDDWDAADRNSYEYASHRAQSQGPGGYLDGGSDRSPEWGRSPERGARHTDAAAAAAPHGRGNSPAPRSPQGRRRAAHQLARGGGKGAAGRGRSAEAWGSAARSTRSGAKEREAAAFQRLRRRSPPLLSEGRFDKIRFRSRDRSPSRAAPPETSPARRPAPPVPGSPTPRRPPERPTHPGPAQQGGVYVPPHKQRNGAPPEVAPPPAAAAPPPSKATPPPAEAAPPPSKATSPPAEAVPPPSKATPSPAEAAPPPSRATPPPRGGAPVLQGHAPARRGGAPALQGQEAPPRSEAAPRAAAQPASGRRTVVPKGSAADEAFRLVTQQAGAEQAVAFTRARQRFLALETEQRDRMNTEQQGDIRELRDQALHECQVTLALAANRHPALVAQAAPAAAAAPRPAMQVNAAGGDDEDEPQGEPEGEPEEQDRDMI